MLITAAFMSSAYATDNRPLGGTMGTDNDATTTSTTQQKNNQGIETGGSTGNPGAPSGLNTDKSTTTTPPTNTGTGGY